MTVFSPASAEALADHLKTASEAGQRLFVFGNNSKVLAAGPILPPDQQISTRSLNRILLYERDDLTVSVEAGMPFRALQDFLQANNQMIALDPPFLADCTVGGVLATDFSGPLRRKFGTARDQVIGMTFAKLDGTLVRAGGMVVKNVAGLDLAKILIGSFGTLAAITSINLRVHSLPRQIQTFLLSYPSFEAALEARDHILQSVLSPWAIELFSPLAAARFGRQGIVLAVRAAGSKAVLDRYASVLKAGEVLSDREDYAFWRMASNLSSSFLARNPEGIVVRAQTPLSDVLTIFNSGAIEVMSHAGSGITDIFFDHPQSVLPLWTLAAQKAWQAGVSFAPPGFRKERELWFRPRTPAAEKGFDMMKQLKQMFDPLNLLNPSRLYGRI